MSNVTAARVHERTDTGFGLLEGVEQSHPRKHGKAEPRKGAAGGGPGAPRLRFVTSVFWHRHGRHLQRLLGGGRFLVRAATREREVSFLSVRVYESAGGLPPGPDPAP